LPSWRRAGINGAQSTLSLAPGENTLQAGTIRIGTRGSPLALAQAREVMARLTAAHNLAAGQCEIVVIKTTGDAITNRPLIEAGGKGLFTKELEEALLAGTVDLAVHSMKDMPALLPEGLSITAVLKREDPHDAFISAKYASLDQLPAGAILGTSSPRRKAQALRLRPDLKIVDFRGNVETRLRKLSEGVADATFLACAGLNRLGMSQHVTAVMSFEAMLPAVAQGAIAIEARSDDGRTAEIVAPLNDQATVLCVTAERAFLSKLEGSCRTPIAGYAELRNGAVHITGEILTPDGRESLTTSRTGSGERSAHLGEEVAADLLGHASPEFLRAFA
jgi:hydroxymethylbilane synthase